ncbi:MAG: hypothetical protein JWN55_2806 [Frankiales bacterium]|jgi:hypothetical protein|nr:hypothetical protein [Frankiales bacterium]
MSDLRADLQADLLADLSPRTEQPPVPAAPPAALPPELSDATPALSVQWTPLRWSRPRVVRAKGGVGKAVQLGPLKLELAVKD